MIQFSRFWQMYDAPNNVPLILDAISKGFASGPVEDAQRYGFDIEKLGTVAVIRTVGPMVKNAGYLTRWGLAGTRDTENAILAAYADAEVESILWIMDTPGGNTDGLFDLAQTVKRVNAEKPITVQVDGMLASAGYYVAAHADTILAAHDNLIGSIGVRTYLVDDHKYYESLGVKIIPVDTGEYKSAGLSGVEVTENHISDVQHIVDGLFETFLNTVEEGRGISREKLTEIADGRVFLSSEAIQHGLIDGIQPLSSTLTQLNEPAAGRSTRIARAALAALDC